MDASRAHFGDGAFDAPDRGFDSYLLDAGDNCRRGSWYEDPWREKVEEEDLRRLSTLAPVNKSNTSLSASSKSRVTSWTNTTITGSLRETPLERKRLSVIQEDGGPHQPSSSAGTHFGGVSVFRKPLPVSPGQAPDPQRLYSALVRRMNQESADREGPEHLHDEELDAAGAPERTIRAVTSPSADDSQNGPCEAKPEREAHNSSQESVYSGHQVEYAFQSLQSHANASICDLQPGIVPFQAQDLQLYRLANRSNPYYSDLNVNEPDLSEDREVPSAEPVSKSSHEASHLRQHSVPDAQYRVIPKFENDASQASLQLHPVSHVREDSQIEPDHGIGDKDKEQGLSMSKSLRMLRKPSRGGGRHRSRSPTPSGSVPDQLSVAKKRFPLLNVRQVSKNNTPIPSRNSSLTRSQSGLLQQAASDQDHSEEHTGREKMAASLRKISPENVANLLKGKRSLAAMYHKKHEKENRPTTVGATPEGEHGHQYAASTPGPSYPAMRSGNNSGHKTRKEGEKAPHESPTELIKATLSARLSRPFNMDTPVLNRPFDSTYLGRREVGHGDVAGGRLSVAQQAPSTRPVLGYDKRRSFERGPGGYGGLGPSPVRGGRSTPDADTALPHIPTPEDRPKNTGGLVGLSRGSKRMVSNFLRSRRKGTSVDEAGASHDENVSTPKTNESGPLFI